MSQSKFNVQEAVQARHKQAKWRCEHIDQDGWRCSKRSVQIAHLIGKGTQGRKAVKPLWFEMTGELLTIKGDKMSSIIHHPINTRAVCGADHNGEFQVNPAQVIKIEQILRGIWEELK